MFLYGLHQEISMGIGEELKKEKDSFGDIIQVVGLVDTYNNCLLYTSDAADE